MSKLTFRNEQALVAWLKTPEARHVILDAGLVKKNAVRPGPKFELEGRKVLSWVHPDRPLHYSLETRDEKPIDEALEAAFIEAACANLTVDREQHDMYSAILADVVKPH